MSHSASELAQAYRRKMLLGESFESSASWEDALGVYREALDFAESDFKKSYVWSSIGRVYSSLGRFSDAIESIHEALRYAEQVPWQEFLREYHFLLAQLFSHIGDYQKGEEYYRRVVEQLKAENNPLWIRRYQDLGRVLLEQARYGEALQVFEECEGHYQKNKDNFHQAMAAISLSQVYGGLGMNTQAEMNLQKAKALLGEEKIDDLIPYFKLLEGRFEIIEGRIAAALRILEEAAHGFEQSNNISGKVEVLLGMSAPLLEHNFVKDAQDIINLLSDWEELKKYPALEHSIQLRRLALGAFSGRWVAKDMELVKHNALSVGRAEDWLQFWFQLSLAAKRFEKKELFNLFIAQAQSMVQKITQHLSEEQKDYFLRRPDIARLFRISEPVVPQQEVQVKAQQITSEQESAAATLAPPVSAKPTRESQ